jgi:dipeptidyl aminopeptidase/acylaminoacyl peptidase
MANLQDMFESERRNYGRHHWVLAYWEDVIAGGEVSKDHLFAISPFNHVAKIKAPVLLVHGEYDKVVPASQSEDMFEVMQDDGKEVEYIELEKGDHYLSSADSRMKAMVAIHKFVKKHI